MKLAYKPKQNHNQTSDFHSKHVLENLEIESKSPIFCESHVYSEIQGSRGERNLSVSFKAQVRTCLRLSSEKETGFGWKTQVQLSGRNKAIANKETSEKNYFQVQNTPAEHPRQVCLLPTWSKNISVQSSRVQALKLEIDIKKDGRVGSIYLRASTFVENWNQLLRKGNPSLKVFFLKLW